MFCVKRLCCFAGKYVRLKPDLKCRIKSEVRRNEATVDIVGKAVFSFYGG